MQFIIGEGFTDWLGWATYRGAIGLFFNTTGGGVLAYCIFGAICFFAVIGFLTVLKWLFIGNKKKPKEPKADNLELNVKRIERDMQELKRQINQK